MVKKEYIISAIKVYEVSSFDNIEIRHDPSHPKGYDYFNLKDKSIAVEYDLYKWYL